MRLFSKVVIYQILVVHGYRSNKNPFFTAKKDEIKIVSSNGNKEVIFKN